MHDDDWRYLEHGCLARWMSNSVACAPRRESSGHESMDNTGSFVC